MSRPNYNADRELIRLQIVVREEYWITSELALFITCLDIRGRRLRTVGSDDSSHKDI